MKIKSLIVVVVLAELAEIVLGWRCPFGNVYIKTGNRYLCKPCKECPAGYEARLGCNNFFPYTNVTKDTCQPCQQGSFKFYRTGSCRYCRPLCDVHEIEVRHCTTTQNRFCACKEGYYRHVVTGRCHIPDKSSMFYHSKKPVVKGTEKKSQ